jgi:hypothetical protein
MIRIVRMAYFIPFLFTWGKIALRFSSLTLTNALNDHPDFHINLGDTFMTEKVKAKTYAEAESTFLDMRPYFGLIGDSVPLFLVNGNHEGELGWLLKGKDKDLPIWSTQLRQLYYPGPAPDDFYSGSSTNCKVRQSQGSVPAQLLVEYVRIN